MNATVHDAVGHAFAQADREGRPRPTAAQLARHLGKHPKWIQHQIGLIRDVEAFAARHEPAPIAEETICACGHEYADHSARGEHRCLEGARVGAVYPCACAAFRVPFGGRR